MLAGIDLYEIVKKTRSMLNRGNRWRNPFGDGGAGERTTRILRKKGQWLEKAIVMVASSCTSPSLMMYEFFGRILYVSFYWGYVKILVV